MNFFTNKKLIVLILISTFILASAIDFVGFKNSSIENNKTTGMIFVNGFEPDLIFANGFESSDFIFANGFDGANIAPIADSQKLSVDEDSVLNITLTSKDPDGDATTYHLDSQPNNGIITGSVPNITYTPTANFNGADEFTFYVNDGTIDSAIATVNITVNPVNDPPIIISTPVISIDLCGNDYNYSVIATDEDNGDVTTYSLSNNPATMVIDPNTGIITWLAADLEIATHSITVLATDQALASDSQTYNLDVLACNLAPVITSTPSQTINEFELFNYDVDAIDPNNLDVLNYSIDFTANAANIDESSGLLSSPLDGILEQGINGSNHFCKKFVENINSLEVVEKTLWPPDNNERRFNIDTTPIVVRTIDSNNDGQIDIDDVPVIIFVAYHSSGELIAVRADTNETVFRTALGLLYSSSTLAAADIDQDGLIEIIGTNTARDGIIVFEHDGTIKYEAPIDTILIGAGYSFPITIADLEGDSSPEILVAGSVLSATGDSLWEIPEATGVWGAPIVADIDNDGVNEVITGGIVYNALNGDVIWESPIARNGRFFSAIVNIDNDDEAELIFVVLGDVYAYEHTGEEIWSTELLGGGFGGAPTIGQVDGNTVIGVAGARFYHVFNSDGEIQWTQAINDRSSSSTGSTMFDFNGDGRVEIAYADERKLRIYDATTGNVLFETINRSHTSVEYPVIADINGDGSAEILLAGQNFIGQKSGLRSFSGTSPWLPTRSIWNQYGYNINNINDDGSVPAVPIKSWLTHNTFRLNTFPDKHPIGLVDLALFNLRLDETNKTEISLEVYNRGLIPTEIETSITIYNGNPNQSGAIIGSLLVPILAANEKQTLILANIDPLLITTNLYASIDEANKVTECLEDNNTTSAALFAVKASDPFGLFDTQRFTVNIENINQAPTIITTDLSNAKSRTVYSDQIQINDPDRGDGFRYELLNSPTGLSINYLTGYLTWLPNDDQEGNHLITVKVTDLGGLTTTKDIMISVEENLQNRSPIIISAPIQSATVNELYQYNSKGFDPDGDVMIYQLLQAPVGMIISPLTGIVTWTPLITQLGSHEITIEVRDSSGATGSQSYFLSLGDINNPNNQAPILSSFPPFAAQQFIPYSYQIIATDPDLDVLLYAKVAGPENLNVDPNTGLLTWIPLVSGEQTVSVSVSDGINTIVQQWTLTVTANTLAINAAPFISSAPIQNAQINTNYNYEVIAFDFENDPLTYQLTKAPEGMSISPLGLVSWQPEKAQIGLNLVTIEVNDDNLHTVSQSFTINVIDPNVGNKNHSPIIISTPSYIIQKGDVYNYAINAIDEEGDKLSYTKVQGPGDLIVDSNTASLTWVPRLAGDYPITIRVSDQQYNVDQQWVIRVIESNLSLESDLIVTPNAGTPGQLIDVYVLPQGNNGEVSVTATIDNQPLTLDANYHASKVLDEIGIYRIAVTISDDLDTIQLEKSVIISDNLDLFAPEIDIHTPTDGSFATGLIDFNISVQDENISQWRLSYRTAEAGEGAVRTEIASGTTNIDHQDVTSFDTSLIRNGIYVFILEAVDAFGQSINIAHSIFIEGDLKIGHFQIAFEDLTIPVAGIPVTITRSYDTRNRNSDEAFGKGWEIGYQSLQLSESRIPGLGWYQTTEYYNIGPVRLPRFCIESIGDRLVSIRLPDDTLEKFKVKAKTLNPTSDERGNCQDIVPPNAFTIEFIPQGDTNSQLRAEGDVASYVVRNGNVEPLADQEIYDPNKYTLTLLDGTIYSIDQGFNLTDIETTDGNSIHFTHDGIEHNNGYSVLFIRDAQERIISIQKPNGDSIDYTYDGNGDLESHTDLMGNTTIFTYILDHYLEDIIDPRGIMVARNEYDAEGRLIAHIDADGNRIEYTHDIAGRTETIKDRNGNSSVFVYDNAGSVIAESNPLGETTFHEYNDIRLETKRIDPLGNETTWTYDNFGNQLTETDVLGNTTTSTYTNRGEIITQTDANGDVIITNEYSDQSNPFAGSGNITKVTNALGHVTEYTWSAGQASNQDTVVFSTGFKDARGNKFEISSISSGTSTGLSGSTTDLNGLKIETAYDDVSTPTEFKQIVTDVNGNTVQEITTSFEYNANSDVIKTTDDLGNITLTEYDQLKRVSATVDANGNRTEFTFDDLGNAIKTTHADGTTELATYDAEGNQLTSTDRAGRVTKTIYDVLNRPIETILPDATPNDDSDNPRGITAYNAIGQMISITDPLGNITQYEYDALGKRTKTIDALGNTTTVAFDSNGIITQKTDALGRITKYETNAIGSIVKTIFPDNTPNDDSDNLFTTKTQDELMLKTSETDLAGKSTQYEYSDGSNLTAVIDPMAQRTEYTYDQRGNKLTQTDANGNTTTWAYDELSRMVSTTLPDGQTKSKTYDAVGNTITKTDFNGDLTTYVHNNLNQLVTTTFADTTTVTSTYTDTGKIASITQTQGITIYQYDAQDRLTRIDYPDNNFIAYGYNLNGNRTQLQTASQTVNYTFDVLNRLATATDSNGTTSYSYDAVGNRASQTNANGTIATYSYDPLNRLTNLVHTDASSNVIASYQYTLGANGNRQRIEEATGRVIDYSYDDLYRLITEDIIDPVNGNHSTEFAYDFVGNRLQQTKDSITTTYLYNNNDLLLTETENTTITSYTYDNNGNTLTKSIDGTLDTEYSYNKENQMIQATTSTSTIVYDYDASGIKYYQNVDGTITNFLIDPNRSYAQVIEEQDSSNNAQVIYLYGDDLITQTRTGSTHTFGYDGLGSTRILTDTNGTVQNSYGYQAFGEQDYQFGTIENSYLFTGEQYDNNIGFYYLRARYYNPSNGRFTQMDTFPGMQFEPRTLHKYLYTANNPINLIDPSGNTFFGGLAAAGRVFGVLAAYGIAAYNVIERVENGIAIYQGVSGLYAAWNKMQAAGLSFNIEGDSEFNEAMQNWDTALYVLSKNMGRIFHDMAGNKKKRDEVQQFVNGAKNKLNVPIMLIYGPTPHQDSPWFDINTRVRLGKLSIGKKKRKIMLELGRKSKSGGRMVGMGHTFTKAKDENTQWWRMDYHGDHGAGSNDWSDDGYHFHTLTAGNKK